MDKRAFNCYFCNELIENDTPEAHLAVCAHVLEPCPFKCGSYIQRSMKNHHARVCPNGIRKSTSKIVENSNYVLNDAINNGKVLSLDRKQPKSVPQFDTYSLYTNTQMELSRVSGRLQMLEQNIRQMDGYTTVNRRCQDEVYFLKSAMGEMKRMIEKLKYQNEVLQEWKKHVETILENVKQHEKDFEKMKEEKSALNNLDTKTKLVNEMAQDVENLVQDFAKERLSNRETLDHLNTKLEDFREFYTQENLAVAALWNDQKTQLNNVILDIRDLSKTIDEQKLKQSTIIYDLKSVNQISSEASQKTDILEREFIKAKADIVQLRSDLRCIEECCTGVTNSSRAANGRLLWKITDFAIKMNEAKGNDVILKSPVFYTHEYGYKVRILLYLNGLNKWKGRNLLAGIHVLKGEYDLLQKWPCHIEANVIIHDLQDRLNPKPISKHVVAKRTEGDEENEEPNESSAQYVFVPHSSVLNDTYVRKDTMFLEVKVTQKVNFESISS